MGWFNRLRLKYFPWPDEILETYLTANEEVIFKDQPSTNAFLVDSANDVAILLGVFFLTSFLYSKGGGPVVAILGFIIIDVLAVRLLTQRLQKMYVRYVLTDSRVMRTWGIFTRHMAFIPWSKVTDVTLIQSFAGRLFGYATVRIESANEASGFKEVSDLHDPWRFYRWIAAIIEERSGKVKPDWLHAGDPPLRESLRAREGAL